MASGNQLIQDYATIANQLGDYFNTITINVSSISSFGTLGSVGNLITLNPDGGSVDITTLPNLTTLNNTTSQMNFDGTDTLFTSQVQVVGHPFIVDNLGGGITNITGGDLTNVYINSQSIFASNAIGSFGTIGTTNKIQTPQIIDSGSNVFFNYDISNNINYVSANTAYFSTINYNQLVPPPQFLIPTTFYVGTTPTSIVHISQSNADLIGHTPFTTTQTGYITANTSIQFENTANSQNYPVWSFMKLTDAPGSNVIYTTEPIANLIQARHTAEIPGYGTTSLLIKSPSPLPADTYNVAVYAYTDSSGLTLTSSRCDILAYSGLA